MRQSICLTVNVLLFVVASSTSWGQDASKEGKSSPGVTRKIQDEVPKKSGKQGPNKKQEEKPAKSSSQESGKKQKSDQSQSGAGKSEKDNQQGTSNTSSNPQQQAADDAFAAYLQSARRANLARTPRMFGDWFRPGMPVIANSETPNGLLLTEVDIPQAGRVGKISENNSALPFDRFFVNYNYFHNALRGGSSLAIFQRAGTASIQRYTIGLERTFLDGVFSLETRFVMTSNPDFGHNPVGRGPSGYQTHSPTFGNLSFVGKALLLENESTALAAGVGLELPTGGDSFIQSGPTLLEFENQAVYLSPYIGLLKKPTDSPWFLNAFVQVETPLSGDSVRGIDSATGTTFSGGRVTSQTTLFVDVALGRWLYQNQGGLLSGVAMFTEAHFNSALNDSDLNSLAFSSNSFNSAYSTNATRKRFDILDLTAGLHIEIADRTKLRVGAVFPVGDEKPFDSEFGIQLTRSR